MKRTLLLLLVGTVGTIGCAGDPFEKQMLTKAQLEAGADSDPDLGPEPDSEPDQEQPDAGQDQDAPGESELPDAQGSETDAQADQDAGPDSDLPEPAPDASPDSCFTTECSSGWICGRIDDGCGGVKICGADYQRSDSIMDYNCGVAAGQPYAWGCGSYGIGIPTSEPAPKPPGPPPMPGCLWSGKQYVIPPDLQQYAWCCPSETLPDH